MEIVLKPERTTHSNHVAKRNKWREEGRRRTAIELSYIAAFHANLALKKECYCRKSVRNNAGRNR